MADSNDLVTRSNTRRTQGEEQRGRTIRHCARVVGAYVFGKLALKRRHLRTLRHPAGENWPPRGFCLALVEYGQRYGNNRPRARHSAPARRVPNFALAPL